MGMFLAALVFASPATAAFVPKGKVNKVLPQFLDLKGRSTLSPSLYERDAYQAHLRETPSEVSGMRFAIHYKAKPLDPDRLAIRLEIRSVNHVKPITLNQPVKKAGLFGRWAEFRLQGEEYKGLGEIVAWRATLWDGQRMLDEQRSFLW